MPKLQLNFGIVALFAVIVVTTSFMNSSSMYDNANFVYVDDMWTILGMSDVVVVMMITTIYDGNDVTTTTTTTETIGINYAYADTQRYPPPLQQQQNGISIDNIMCNAPNQLYIKDSSIPVCITTSTYDHLLMYGLDLISYDVYVDAIANSIDDSTPAPPSSVTPSQPDIITIGTITPLTGGAAGYGQDILAGAELAVSDFNMLLEERDESWRLAMESLDSMTSRDKQLDSIVAFNERGIKIINGPSIDLFDSEGLDYANDNDMLLLSCCSVVVSYGISDDAMLRLSANQSNHGSVIAELMIDEGISVMATTGRDAPWITDMLDSAAERFVELGGTVLTQQHILYNGTGQFDNSTIQTLADTVASVESEDIPKTGVLFVGFEESYDFLESASTHDVLGQVRWFGADINTILHDNPTGLEFAELVRFMSVQPAIETNEINTHVSEKISNILGRTPTVYTLLSYDAVHIIGHSILNAKSTMAADLIDAIPHVAKDYSGASGSISFNHAGDRESMTYDVWLPENGVWVVNDFLK